MDWPRFVITGTGRCGTGYVSRVLTAAGIECGHENRWAPEGPIRFDIVGDASWCALAYGLDDYDGVVWHQWRHPLDVVTSLACIPPHEPYRSLYERLMPDSPDDPIEWAALAAVTYVDAALARANGGWSVETDVTPRFVQWVGGVLGIRVTSQRSMTAVDSVPVNVNGHWGVDRLSLGDVPSTELRDRVAVTMTMLRYEEAA